MLCIKNQIFLLIYLFNNEQIKEKYSTIKVGVEKMNINSILLAGGQNKRMNGTPKWELQFGHLTMLERSIVKLSTISKKIFVISGGDYTFEIPKVEGTEIDLIYDKKPFLGPLNGIHTALMNSDEKYNFIIAADMPFFSTKLVNYMKKIAENKYTDLVIPVWKEKLQPLHGLYATSLLPSIKMDLQQNKYSLIKWIQNQKNIYYIEEAELLAQDINEHTFFNMNFPMEYKEALFRVKEEEDCE